MNRRRRVSDADRVRHIRKAASKLAEVVADGRDMFDASWRHQDLAAYQPMIIGEAAGHLSEEFVAAHPGLEVAQAKALRNVVVHQYDDDDPAQVWTVLIVSVPEFVEALPEPPPIEPPVPPLGAGI